MADTLQTLIQRIEDGSATAAELEQVRALLDAFAWSDVSLASALADEAAGIDITGAVLDELGVEIEPIADAVIETAGAVDVADAVMAALGDGDSLPMTAAIHDEAGAFDAAASILAALELDSGAPVAEAVRDEAGRVEIVAGVMASIEAEVAPVGQAVRDEAGVIDIADAVMASLAAPAAMPTAVTTAPSTPVAANNTARWLVGMLAAAMVAMVLGLGGYLGGVTSTAGSGGMQIAATDGDTDVLPGMVPELAFASASEVQIEDLSFGDDVVVFQDEGDDGALILWVDEEVL